MLKESYLFDHVSLIIIDPELGIHIQEKFAPPLIPASLANNRDPSLHILRWENQNYRIVYFQTQKRLEGQCHFYYPTGSLQMECYYKGGKRHGPSKSFSREGKCLSETWFAEDRPEGKSKRYYLSGNLYSVERYKEGKLEGIQEHYYENGQPRTTLSYHQGLLEGKGVLYWPNQQKKRECHFTKGQRQGWDLIWNPKGVLIDRGEYDRDVPIGTHQRYHDNGRLATEKVYKTGGQCRCREWDDEGRLNEEKR